MGTGNGKGKGHHGGRRGRPGAGPNDPAEMRITQRQATYFAERTDLTIDELTGERLLDVEERLKLHLPSELWFHQRVCGRVVRTDPVTGEKRGVPFATVHVEDTDCSFLGFFPVEHPLYWWLYPVSCSREVVATTTTDECGNFCVNIPRWELDRVLRLREERRCFLDLGRPRLPKLDEIQPPWLDPGVRFPGPIDPVTPIDPSPVKRFGERIESTPTGYVPRIAAPVDDAAMDRAGAALPDDLRLADLSTPVGPFLRCDDVYYLEWETFTDVPDITFRVTQDVDGDGNEEVIYSEGWFDVRWNDTTIHDVELEASAIAVATDVCGGTPGDGVPCSDEPALLQIGRMPVTADFLDANGYATRVNRPRDGGSSAGAAIDPAESPFTGALQLSGCYDVAGAAYFRVLDEFGGTEAPIVGSTWTVGSTQAPFWIQMTPDGSGWYSVADAEKQVDPHLVMNVRVQPGRSGQHAYRLEIADAAKNHLAFSDPLPVQIDDRRPAVDLLSVAWIPAAATDWSTATELLGSTCPVLERPASTDVLVRVQWSASADHFRRAWVHGFGCGTGNVLTHEPALSGGTQAFPAGPGFGRWHASVAETGMVRSDVFRLPQSNLQGAYGVTVRASSRAFSPAGSAGLPTWHFNPEHSYRVASYRFAVIDA